MPTLPSNALIAFALLLSAAPLRAQAPVADPADVGTIPDIVRVSYEVISGPAGTPRQWKRDSTLYMPGATFVSTAEHEGKVSSQISTPEEYRQAVNASFVKNGFIEREIGNHTDRFGNVAQVRSSYESRRSVDGPIEARGVNLFMLYWDGKRWWITSMAWDDERPNNPIPKTWISGPDAGSRKP